MAALTVAVWDEAGLHASHVQAKGTTDGVLHAAYTICQGDLCERKSLHVPAASLSGAPSLRLTHRMLTQPVALAAVGGMILLTTCCLVVSEETNRLLDLVGGREWGWFILFAALAAHAFEGFIAFIQCLRVGFGFAAAVQWGVLTSVTGFPILRWVLKLPTPKQQP